MGKRRRLVHTDFAEPEPTREDIDRLPGPVLVEFGTDWCPYCQAVQPHLRQLLAQYPQVRHVKVEDGKGRPLGRTFRVKLWPNLVFLRDGHVITQLARPTPQEIRVAFESLAGGTQPMHSGKPDA
jgi:thioredoxin 1